MNAMLPKTYGLNFVGVADLHKLEAFVKNDPRVLAYWNYLPLVYCMKSFATAAELAEALLPLFPNGQFLVFEVNPTNMNGRLPKAAWEWFYSQAPSSNAMADYRKGAFASPDNAMAGRGTGAFGSSDPDWRKR